MLYYITVCDSNKKYTSNRLIDFNWTIQFAVIQMHALVGVAVCSLFYELVRQPFVLIGDKTMTARFI